MKPCLYCGNNPIPHFSHKLHESSDILFGKFRRFFFLTWVANIADQVTDVIGLGLFYTLKPLGLIQINTDINKILYPRAKVLWEEALRRGIKIEEIKPFGRSIDLYRAYIKNKPIYFMNLPRIESVSNSNLSWIDDKYLLKKKLLEHGLPVSPGEAFTSLNKALQAFSVLNKPLIIKPRGGSRGRHTTTFIYTEEDFRKAFKIAKQLCHWVIVEEHLFGDVQRGTVIGGKLIGVLGGSPPRITGDDIHTIAELIKIKDANRPQMVKKIKVNEYFMQRHGLNMDTILENGRTVDLSEKIGVNYGGTSYDCTDQTHPDTKAMFAKAGQVLECSVLGFDFIIPDITKSYKEQKCGIIECNGAPFLQLHYDPLYGQTINAAKYVWDLVESK